MQAMIETTTQLAQGGGAPGAGIWLMAIGFALTCIIMMLVVLIQKPKGGGLSGAFGGGAGGGSSQAFIGGGVGNVLTVFTVVCFLIFLLLAGTMTLAINKTLSPPEPTSAQDDRMPPASGATLAPPADERDERPAGQPAGQPAAPPATDDQPDSATPDAGTDAQAPEPDAPEIAPETDPDTDTAPAPDPAD